MHTGTAFVGAIGSEHQREFTALGDAVNVTARLASFAAPGEVLVTDDAFLRSGGDRTDAELRRLELRGKSEPTDVRVVRVGSAESADQVAALRL